MWVQVSDGYDLEGTQRHVETAGTSEKAEGNQSGAQSHTEESAVNAVQEAVNNSSANEAATLPAASHKKRLDSTSPLAPIWTVQAQPVFFDAERPQAKELAKAFVALQE